MSLVVFDALFEVSTDDGKAMLRDMTTSRQTLESYGTLELREELQYCQNVCKWAEACYVTPRLYTKKEALVLGFRRLGISCSCIWSEVLVRVIDLAIRVLYMSATLDDIPTATRKTFVPALYSTRGCMTYLKQRALPSWVDKDLPRFKGYDEATIEHVYMFIRAYSLWNAACIEYEEAKKPVAAIAKSMHIGVAIGLDLDASADIVGMGDPKRLKATAALFYECHRQLTRLKGNSLVCGGRLECSDAVSLSGNVIVCSGKSDYKDVILRPGSGVSPDLSLTHQVTICTDTSKYTWSERARTKWLEVCANYYASVGEYGNAIACCRCEVNNQGDASKLGRYEALISSTTVVHVPSEAPIPSWGGDDASKLMSRGGLPIDWAQGDDVMKLRSVLDFPSYQQSDEA